MTIYVTCTDKLGTSWSGRTSKMVYVCENAKQANEVEVKLMKRDDVRYIYRASVKPDYSKNNYQVSFYDHKGMKLKYN